jgi:hypothetical protein
MILNLEDDMMCHSFSEAGFRSGKQIKDDFHENQRQCNQNRDRDTDRLIGRESLTMSFEKGDPNPLCPFG